MSDEDEQLSDDEAAALASEIIDAMTTLLTSGYCNRQALEEMIDAAELNAT